jgi:hypothetical protein
MELFSFNANKWKQWEGPNFPYKTSDVYYDLKVGLLFNETIHWIAYYCDRLVDLIVGFDLMERIFFEIALPDFNFDFDFVSYEYWEDFFVYVLQGVHNLLRGTILICLLIYG